ncbi:hypothetical protein D3C72_928730 [compost metagenome]
MNGVDLVDDHAFQILKIVARAFPGAEQGQLFRRGQQNVRRGDLLALAASLPGIARAGFDHDRQIHFPNRREQVPLHIDRQGFQGRNVERVKRFSAVARTALGQVDQAGQETG